MNGNDRNIRMNDDYATTQSRRTDLDQLVVFCQNDVWQAITLLRNYCSACTCWRDCISVPAGPSKSVRSKQPKKHHVLPTPLPTKHKRSTKLLCDYQNNDDDEGGEDHDDDEENDNKADGDKPSHRRSHVNNTEQHRKRIICNFNVNGHRIRDMHGNHYIVKSSHRQERLSTNDVHNDGDLLDIDQSKIIKVIYSIHTSNAMTKQLKRTRDFKFYRTVVFNQTSEVGKRWIKPAATWGITRRL